MEWDWGFPWYCPVPPSTTAHTSAEFGWRSGTGRWPDYYLDSLGTVLDVGVGSPTASATASAPGSPAKYQKAIYALDWTYGRIVAVHLKPSGSSYTGPEGENFVAPK